MGKSDNKIIIQAWLAEIDSFEAEMSLNIQHINNNDEAVTDDSEEETRQVLILQLESAEEGKMEWSFVVSTGTHPCSIKDRSAVDFNFIDTSRNPVKEVGLQEKSVLYQLAKNSIGAELESISKDVVKYANQKLSESQVLNDYLDTLQKMGKLDIIEKYKEYMRTACDFGEKLLAIERMKHVKSYREIMLLSEGMLEKLEAESDEREKQIRKYRRWPADNPPYWKKQKHSSI